VKRNGYTAIVVIGKFVFGVIRFVLFVLLLLLGHILRPIAGVAMFSGGSLFLFCLFIRPDMTTPMWAGAGLAIASTALLLLYEMVLVAVAPAGIEIISEI